MAVADFQAPTHRFRGDVAQALLAVADRFSPPGVSVDPDSLGRTRAVVAFSWLAGGAALAALLVTAWQDGAWPPRRNLVFAAIVALLAMPHLMRSTRSVALASWLLVGAAVTGLVASAYNNGGMDSFSVPLFPAVPVAAGILLGVRAGALLSVGLGLVCVGLYAGRDALPEPLTPPELRSWLVLVMLEISFGVAIGSAWLFAFLQKRAASEAQEASRAKSEFLANMSHELRTPLNGVVGFCDLLLQEPLGERQRGYAESVRGSGEALLRLVDDLLDLGRLERNQLELLPEDFDLAALVHEVADWNRLAADRQGLDLRVELDEGSLGRRHGDAHRLRQILLNLVGNSLKFTESGSVVIRALADGERVRFEIVDTGIGVAPESQQRIFDRFAQGDGSVARRFGGSGLGLAISRLIVQAMGGAIGVDSAEGEGSTFWFEVILPPASDPGALPARSPDVVARPQAGLRVLVAEDNPVNRELVTSLLERRGHLAIEAEDGREALARAREQRFDVILMDAQMPDIDGLTATRKLRADPDSPSRDTPVIALTAGATEADRVRCHAAGMEEFLAKPLRPAALDGALARAVGEIAAVPHEP